MPIRAATSRKTIDGFLDSISKTLAWFVTKVQAEESAGRVLWDELRESLAEEMEGEGSSIIQFP
jgi:hypothetical protein